MTVLLGALASFSAFGAAIVAFVASGGAVQDWAVYLRDHGLAEAAARFQQSSKDEKDQAKLERAQRRAGRRPYVVIGSTSTVIGLVVLSCGGGLVVGALWFYHHAADSTGWVWAYQLTFYLFIAAAGLLSASTAFFVAVGAISGLTGAKKDQAA